MRLFNGFPMILPTDLPTDFPLVLVYFLHSSSTDRPQSVQRKRSLLRYFHDLLLYFYRKLMLSDRRNAAFMLSNDDYVISAENQGRNQAPTGTHSVEHSRRTPFGTFVVRT